MVLHETLLNMAEGPEVKNDDVVIKEEHDVGWAGKNLDNFGEYCFETDQLALKGNSDYQALLRYHRPIIKF